MGVILLTECLPQEPDFEDQGDLCRGQRPGKESELWETFFLIEGLPQEPDFEDQGDLCGGQTKQKESDGCHSPVWGLTSGA
jgi:hypothetical protein